MSDRLLSMIDRISDSDKLIDFLIEILVASEYSDNTMLSELLILLDRKSLFNLIVYMGGETIKIPNLSEFYDSITDVIAVYMYKSEVSISEINEDLNSSYDKDKLDELYENYIELISTINIPRRKEV